jgi:hypothetical protein
MRADVHHDFAVLDDGAGLRRVGSLLMAAGAVVGLCGLATLTLARITWSGYVTQGLLALLAGGGCLAFGWRLLREGDRRGPRLVSFVRATRTPRPPTVASPTRRHVGTTLPYGALPVASPRRALPAPSGHRTF